MTLPERLHRPGWKILGALFLVALIMTGAWGARAAGRQMADPDRALRHRGFCTVRRSQQREASWCNREACAASAKRLQEFSP